MPDIFHQPQPKPSPPTTKTGRAKTSLLSAFMVRPNGIRFETQEESEEILLLMRKHPVTNLGWIFVTVGLILVPIFFSPLILSSQIVPPTAPIGLYFMMPILWYLGVFGYAFTSFLGWYYNIYIVTNQRIIDIDWINLLYKQISSTQLRKIQDVTYKQGGLLDSFFDFGNVFIQTAGTEPNFEFEAVPKPEKVVRQINQYLEQQQKEKT